MLHTLLAAIFLALIHLFANRLRLSFLPRSKWLSFAGGISVTYIFIHLLPELEEWQQEAGLENMLSFLEHHLYLISLLGLSFFYGLERAAKLSRQSRRDDKKGGEDFPKNARIFWIHISSFSFYNLLIGYLLVHRDVGSLRALIIYSLAMAFHFLVNDYGLADHYQGAYRKTGRWILTAAILVGWGVGMLTEIPEAGLAVLFAILVGGVILNVLKEELPEERKSNFWAFLAGIVLYSFLLLISA